MLRKSTSQSSAAISPKSDLESGVYAGTRGRSATRNKWVSHASSPLTDHGVHLSAPSRAATASPTLKGSGIVGVVHPSKRGRDSTSVVSPNAKGFGLDQGVYAGTRAKASVLDTCSKVQKPGTVEVVNNTVTKVNASNVMKSPRTIVPGAEIGVYAGTRAKSNTRTESPGTSLPTMSAIRPDKTASGIDSIVCVDPNSNARDMPETTEAKSPSADVYASTRAKTSNFTSSFASSTDDGVYSGTRAKRRRLDVAPDQTLTMKSPRSASKSDCLSQTKFTKAAAASSRSSSSSEVSLSSLKASGTSDLSIGIRPIQKAPRSPEEMADVAVSISSRSTSPAILEAQLRRRSSSSEVASRSPSPPAVPQRQAKRRSISAESEDEKGTRPAISEVRSRKRSSSIESQEKIMPEKIRPTRPKRTRGRKTVLYFNDEGTAEQLSYKARRARQEAELDQDLFMMRLDFTHELIVKQNQSI